MNQLTLSSQLKPHVNFEKGISLSAEKNDERSSDNVSRRSSFSKIASAAYLSTVPSSFFVTKAIADDGDLTSQLFNSDGSLKEGSSLATEATFRSVSLTFPEEEDASVASTSPFIFTNGESKLSFPDAKYTRKVNYQTPTKWTDDSTYKDTTTSVNLSSCNRIIAYQSPTKISSSILEKAATIGIAKALQAQSSGAMNIENADLVAGKKEEKDGVTYWNFDLAVAPRTCNGENKKENLGLGFCPYDYIVLFSAAVINERLYVFQLECDRDQWRRSNGDLKRVRQSFTVEV